MGEQALHPARGPRRGGREEEKDRETVLGGMHGGFRPWVGCCWNLFPSQKLFQRPIWVFAGVLGGGLNETSAEPQDRAGSPRGVVLGRARISDQYERYLRPALAPPIAPLRRATFR